MQHVARQRALAAARHTGHDRKPPERDAHVGVLEVVEAHAEHIDVRRFALDRAARLDRVPERVRQESPRERIGLTHQFRGRALRHHLPAERAGSRAQIDDVLGVTDGVLVVLHHHQGVALGFELGQRVQQNPVVARMQADGGLVQDVAHAAQVGPELGCQPDALGLAAGKRRCRAVQGQIRQSHVLQEGQARLQLRQNVARNLGASTFQAHVMEEALDRGHRQGGEVGDGAVLEADVQRRRIQPLALARGASLIHLEPFQPGVEDMVLGPGPLAFLIPADVAELQSGPEAGLAPPVLGVEGEQPRVELGEAGAAGRAGALGRERRLGHLGVALHEPIQRRDDLHYAFTELQRARQRLAQRCFVRRLHAQIRYRQLDAVLLEARQPRPLGGW